MQYVEQSKAETARSNVTVAEIAALSRKSCQTISDRIKGEDQFPIQNAIEAYILRVLKNPTSSGTKVKLVLELVAILERNPTPRSSQDDSQAS